jgi:hypothetical protein
MFARKSHGMVFANDVIEGYTLKAGPRFGVKGLVVPRV